MAVVALVAAAGCGGDGGGLEEVPPQAFVMDPDLHDVEGGTAAVRGTLSFAGGADIHPEYAKAVRCVVLPGEVVVWLQVSAAHPGNLALGLAFTDPVSGEEWRTAEPDGPQPAVDRDADIRSGRQTYVTRLPAPGLAPDARTAETISYGDCRATLYPFS